MTLAYKVGKCTVLYEKKPGSHDVVFHEDFLGFGLAAFETHGTASGQLMNSRGQYKSAMEVALHDIAPRLQHANYPPGMEFILLACEGGSSGAAQKVAKALNRPVEGFDKVISVKHPSLMQLTNFSQSHQQTNIPTHKIGLWERMKGVKGPFSDSRKIDYATSRTYFP